MLFFLVLCNEQKIIDVVYFCFLFWLCDSTRKGQLSLAPGHELAWLSGVQPHAGPRAPAGQSPRWSLGAASVRAKKKRVNC